MFRVLFALILFIISGISYSSSLSPTEFPVCKVDGKDVEYRPNRRFIWSNHVFIAMAFKDTYGKRYIYYDPYAFKEAPKSFQIWVALHECKHQLDKHLTSPHGYSSPKQRMEEEQVSDKYATTKIVEMGFTDEQIEEIYNTILDDEFLTRHSSPSIARARRMMHKTIKKESEARAEYFKLCVQQARQSN